MSCFQMYFPYWMRAFTDWPTRQRTGRQTAGACEFLPLSFHWTPYQEKGPSEEEPRLLCFLVELIGIEPTTS